MKLYNSKLSPRARRVRVCANELGVKLELVDMSVAAGDMRKPEYLAKNVMGKIPTLEDDDGWTLWESRAILVYLASKYPANGLLPTEPRPHAETMRWLFFDASHFEPPVAAVTFERRIKPILLRLPTDERRCAEACVELDRYAPVLDRQLAERSFVAGDQLTIADIALGTSAEQAEKLELGLSSRFPNIAAWMRRLAERPAWQET